MDAYLEVLGRSHPLVLHLPIGALLALVVLELVARARGEPLPRSLAGTLVGLAALSAVAAAGTGWLLGGGPDYGASEVLFRHRWLGVALCAALALAGLCHAARATRAYGALLAVATLLLVPVGHFGATMTHGKGYLTEPLREAGERRRPERDRPAPAPGTEAQAPPVVVAVDDVAPGPEAPPAPSTYEAVIAPILASRCTSCHGAEKQKGGFALHTPEAIRAAAAELPLFRPDPPFGPAFVERLTLPLADPDHMPPEGKPQPDPAQLAALLAWAEAGAPLEGIVDSLPEVAGPPPAPAADAPSVAVEAPPPAPAAPAAPDPAALAALEEAFVHVERLDPGRGGLWIDFAAVATSVEDEDLARLLAPLREHVVQLDLARARAGQRTLALCARMPRLERLDLRACPVGDEDLSPLADHPTLVELVLAQTRVSGASVELLAGLPALRRVFLWGSALSPEDVARLRAARPDLEVDDGAAPAPAVLEEEPEVRFTRAGEGGTEATAAPRPLNSVCPVSGSPVDPRYGALWEGRLIGFCCAQCPKAFWEDPAAFAAKLD